MKTIYGNKELIELFGDERLNIPRGYESRLKQQLGIGGRTAKRHTGQRIFIPFVLAFGVIAAVLAVSVFRPVAPEQLAGRMVLIKSLYATALADNLPKLAGTTFWQITQSDMRGPAAAACGYNITTAPVSSSTTYLYYKNANVSAIYSYGGYADTNPQTGYSEDAQTPAFTDEAISQDQSHAIRTSLYNATLTDAHGKDLSTTAQLLQKQTGVYDIYAREQENSLGCLKPSFMHLQINATTGNFVSIDTYLGSMSPSNLADHESQTVATKSAKSFAEVLPIFTIAGFKMASAQAVSSSEDYINVANQAAGLMFFYHKSVLGNYTEHDIKNSAGQIIEYRYTFSLHSEIIYHFRTAAGANTVPSSVASLKNQAMQNNWTVFTDVQSQPESFNGYNNVTAHLFMAHDTSTTYILNETGSTDIPTVYVTAPYGEGDYQAYDSITDSNITANDLTDPAVRTANYFQPGSAVPPLN